MKNTVEKWREIEQYVIHIVAKLFLLASISNVSLSISIKFGPEILLYSTLGLKPTTIH